jgi:hypothetical protein
LRKRLLKRLFPLFLGLLCVQSAVCIIAGCAPKTILTAFGH